MGDPGTSAKPPNFNESESCANLSQNTAEHDIASDLSTELRKLKQAYEILSSKKDKEVSALLSERDFVCDQMSIMEQDFAALLKKLKAAQATEAAQKLQQNINELQVLAEKKDDEISRLRAKAVSAKEKIDYLQLLVKEKMMKSKDSKVGSLRLFQSVTRISVRHIKDLGMKVQLYGRN